MCGISGFAGAAAHGEAAGDRLRRMCDAILHRGPDSEGLFLRPGIAMGMRRLSIIDVQGGTQPIYNEDGSVAVVFNGEIYNHRALRADLESRGHRFKTSSDTEVLVHLYEEFGTAMATRLEGMFAFSIWDAPRRRLYIARDRAGMKPLSYRVSAEGIEYFSELRSLVAGFPDAARIAQPTVPLYLMLGYVPDPLAIYDSVRKLPPAHWLTWDERAGLHVERYWSPGRPVEDGRTEAELVAELRGLLDHAVRSHLESEVPLGAFLSGGVDSSTVVALMARHAHGQVRTFSIGFADAEYDESESARQVAEVLGTAHTAITVRPDVENLFESVASMFDEPFGDSSAIPTFLVSQLARESVTVALSGDGGDELFGGYERYGRALRQSQLPRPIGRLAATVGKLLPHDFPGRYRLVDLGRSREGRYVAQVAQPSLLDEGGVVAKAMNESALPIEQLFHDAWDPADSDFAAAIMRFDLQTYLPGDILTKVDRSSMAVSLEARVPLLDCRLVDFALQLPSRWRVTRTATKRLFRTAIADIVPPAVLTRPKAGFTLPLAPWFRGVLRPRIEALRSPSPSLSCFVDARATGRLVDEHLAGRRDHSVMLWRLIVLQHWLDGLAAGRQSRSPAIPRYSA
jgi:asparagine synthase (glutamine-hydrolysing)